MKSFKMSILSFLTLCSCMEAQTNEIPMTPVNNVPLIPQKIAIPDKFKSVAGALSNVTVNLPEGWEVSLYYTAPSLAKTRFMAWSPDSVLHITDMNSARIIALPDKDNDGVADTAITIATNVSAHSIQFYNGALYAAETDQVLKLTDENNDGKYETATPIITGIPTGGNHTTRTIVFDATRKKLYLSIGSRCNVCREDTRAIIKEYNDDGTGGRIYATGIRNAVGMTLHPVTGKLWANNNGSDIQGDNIPPEWTDIVRENGFYGYPFSYHFQQYFDFNAANDYKALLPMTAADSARVRSMKMPGALIQAHSAPMGIDFSNASFPAGFQNGAFMALRGAWNSSLPIGSRPGYKLVYLQFDSPTDTIASGVTDIATGFQTPGGAWARPVGVALDNKGNIFLGSDDLNKFVLKITPKKITGINENKSLKKPPFSVFPNPASENLTIRISEGYISNAIITITDILGKEVQRVQVGEPAVETVLQTGNLQIGTYFCKIHYKGTTEVQEFQIIR